MPLNEVYDLRLYRIKKLSIMSSLTGITLTIYWFKVVKLLKNAGCIYKVCDFYGIFVWKVHT